MAIVHQHDNNPVIAPLRMCIAAAHKCPIITEIVNDAGIFELFIMQAGYPGLTRTIQYCLNKPDVLRKDGEALYQFMCQTWTFRDSIEAALA